MSNAPYPCYMNEAEEGRVLPTSSKWRRSPSPRSFRWLADTRETLGQNYDVVVQSAMSAQKTGAPILTACTVTVGSCVTILWVRP